QFGRELADKLHYGDSQALDEDERKNGVMDSRQTGERKVVRVYQIWDKEGGKKVRYITEQYQDNYLKVLDDPLLLTGFFNCPQPLTFLAKAHSLIPTSLYHIYENQAKELNKIQRRINHLVDAVKARGFYDGEMGDEIKSLLNVEECGLVPTDKGSSL